MRKFAAILQIRPNFDRNIVLETILKKIGRPPSTLMGQFELANEISPMINCPELIFLAVEPTQTTQRDIVTVYVGRFLM